MSILSRQKLARSFENKEKRSKEVVKNQNKTVTTSLNEYRASVELANYRFCVKCNSNFNEASARVIKPKRVMRTFVFLVCILEGLKSSGCANLAQMRVMKPYIAM